MKWRSSFKVTKAASLFFLACPSVFLHLDRVREYLCSKEHSHVAINRMLRTTVTEGLEGALKYLVRLMPCCAMEA